MPEEDVPLPPITELSAGKFFVVFSQWREMRKMRTLDCGADRPIYIRGIDGDGVEMGWMPLSP
mgnify:CR=1 FL=1